MTGAPLLLSRSRSAWYCLDVATKHAHLPRRSSLTIAFPSLSQIPSRDSAIGDTLLGAKSRLLQDPHGSDHRDAQCPSD
jgi:hypothetical protein